jgi:hypothetical protein
VVYQVALAGHWLVMGLKIDSSPIDTWLSKMEAAIENIVCLSQPLVTLRLTSW